MEPFLGQVQIFGFSFPPRGWSPCNGNLIAIAQNTALFSLLGTVYGGNGQTTFGLPNLCSRLPVGTGSNTLGLQAIQLGEMSGTQTHTLISTEMPIHNHAVGVNVSVHASTNTDGATAPTAGSYFASLTGVSKGGLYSSSAGTTVQLGDTVASATATAGNAGGSQPFSILNPYLGMNYCIALQGVFPSRN